MQTVGYGDTPITHETTKYVTPNLHLQLLTLFSITSFLSMGAECFLYFTFQCLWQYLQFYLLH